MSDVLFTLWRALQNILIQTVRIRVVTAGETFGAHSDLLNQLGKKLALIQTDWHRNSLTMLFCPITSRVGSDVEAAIDLVRGDDNVILVLMHHTRDRTYSTAGMDWSERFPNVISSVHVLFHESVPGLLACSKNKMAVDEMLKVLKYNSEICWRRSFLKIFVGLAVTSLAIFFSRRYHQREY